MSEGVPAAWYPDPADGRMVRYWDGSGWTQQVRDAVIAHADSAKGAPLTDAAGYAPAGRSAAYVPFTAGSAQTDSARVRPPTGSASTAAIWLYALVPLLLLLHQYFAWDYSVTDFTAVVIHGVIAVVTVVLALVLTTIDRSQLQNRGFQRTPPAILGLLPPIHMIARALATGPGAILVTLASLIVQTVVVVMLVILSAPAGTAAAETTGQPVVTEGMTAPFTDAQLAFLLTPEGMQEKIIFDALESSVHYEGVECKPLTSTDLGAQTTCQATGALASYELLVQVLPNGTSVPFAVVSITPILE